MIFDQRRLTSYCSLQLPVTCNDIDRATPAVADVVRDVGFGYRGISFTLVTRYAVTIAADRYFELRVAVKVHCRHA